MIKQQKCSGCVQMSTLSNQDSQINFSFYSQTQPTSFFFGGLHIKCRCCHLVVFHAGFSPSAPVDPGLTECLYCLYCLYCLSLLSLNSEADDQTTVTTSKYSPGLVAATPDLDTVFSFCCTEEVRAGLNHESCCCDSLIYNFLYM